VQICRRAWSRFKTAVDKADKSIALLIERDGRQIYVPVRLS